MNSIKYASMQSLECPKCGSNDIKINQIKTRFGKMLMSDIPLDIADFNRPNFEGSLRREYSKIGADTDEGILQDVLDGDLPKVQLICDECGNKWIPEVGTGEADPSDRLDDMGFIVIHREKKVVGSAVPILVLINGVLSPVMLKNGQTAVYPTMVKHNRIQYIYNKAATLSNHTSTMKVMNDVEVGNGQAINVSVSAKMVFG